MDRKQRPAERATTVKKPDKPLGPCRRHEVSDEQWAFLGALIPRHTARTGRTPKDPPPHAHAPSGQPLCCPPGAPTIRGEVQSMKDSAGEEKAKPE